MDFPAPRRARSAPRAPGPGLAAAALAIALAGTAGARAQDASEYHRRADIALQSFLLHFWSQGLDSLSSSFPDQGWPTGYWTFAQGFDALLDGVERTGGEAYFGLIETFHDAQERRGWWSDWYDDENWMALALIRAHDLTGDPRYLATAVSLYQDIMGGWDTTCCGAVPGGIWWDKGHSQKATASNLGPVITGVRLGERTGDDSYLTFAAMVYDYWWQNMVNPSTHQVLDHIDPDGTKVPWRFTYNEGLFFGASVELFRATGDLVYRQRAVSVWSYVSSEEVANTGFGKVLNDGSNESCDGDCHQFKGIAYRYLMSLYDSTKGASYRDVLLGSAKAIWALARSPSDDLFSVSWAGPPMTEFSVSQVSSAVMALNIWARSAGPYPGTGRPAGRYEAEEASIHGVGLEAVHAGFTGWGYVAGWNGDGQRVDFKVRVDSPGGFQVSLRYAAAAGGARRAVLIDGQVAARDLSFPGTGSWGSYAAVDLEASLAAGPHTISVLFDSSKGSSNFLNLDHLDLVRRFIRGDANADGLADLSDVMTTLGRLFLDSPAALSCERSADANGDGAVDISDPLFLLFFLFAGGPAPGSPFPGCGTPAAPDGLACEAFGFCG